MAARARKKTTAEVVAEIEDAADLGGEDDKSPPAGDDENHGFLTTGCAVFDCASGGGHGIGKVVNIVGDASTGKTLLALETIAANRVRLGKKLKWFYDDAEAGLSFNTRALYGFDAYRDGGIELTRKERNEKGVLVDVPIFASTGIEDFAVNVYDALNQTADDEYLIYVLDSLDALTSFAEEANMETLQQNIHEGKDEKEGSYDLERQKELSKFFRLFCRDIKDRNCLVLVLSQLRMKINVRFGSPFYRAGGKALDFYAAQIWWLHLAEKFMKKKTPVGICIRANNTKNKLGMPMRECFINMFFDYGVDDVGTGIDYLYDLKTDTGKMVGAEKKDVPTTTTAARTRARAHTRAVAPKKKSLVWDDLEFANRNSLIAYIEEKGFEAELRQRVHRKWQDFEDSIATTGRKRRYDRA